MWYTLAKRPSVAAIPDATETASARRVGPVALCCPQIELSPVRFVHDHRRFMRAGNTENARQGSEVSVHGVHALHGDEDVGRRVASRPCAKVSQRGVQVVNVVVAEQNSLSLPTQPAAHLQRNGEMQPFLKDGRTDGRKRG